MKRLERKLSYKSDFFPQRGQSKSNSLTFSRLSPLWFAVYHKSSRDFQHHGKLASEFTTLNPSTYFIHFILTICSPGTLINQPRLPVAVFLTFTETLLSYLFAMNMFTTWKTIFIKLENAIIHNCFHKVENEM